MMFGMSRAPRRRSRMSVDDMDMEMRTLYKMKYARGDSEYVRRARVDAAGICDERWNHFPAPAKTKQTYALCAAIRSGDTSREKRDFPMR